MGDVVVLGVDIAPLPDLPRELLVRACPAAQEIAPHARFAQRAAAGDPAPHMAATRPQRLIFAHVGQLPQHVPGDDAAHAVGQEADIVARLHRREKHRLQSASDRRGDDLRGEIGREIRQGAGDQPVVQKAEGEELAEQAGDVRRLVEQPPVLRLGEDGAIGRPVEAAQRRGEGVAHLDQVEGQGRPERIARIVGRRENGALGRIGRGDLVVDVAVIDEGQLEVAGLEIGQRDPGVSPSQPLAKGRLDHRRHQAAGWFYRAPVNQNQMLRHVRAPHASAARSRYSGL